MRACVIPRIIKYVGGKTERVSFEVDEDFKAAIDLEIARRRSTLRREGTQALAAWLGIQITAPPVEDDKDHDAG